MTVANEPLRIAELPFGDRGGVLGLSLCPGRRQASDGGRLVHRRSLQDDLDAVWAWGAGTVVTLMEERELRECRVLTIGREVRRRGMRWVHFPITDLGVPIKSASRLWRDGWSNTFQTELFSGGRVFVHCRGGKGRAGMVSARLLVDGGLCTPRVAVDRVRAVRPGAIETKSQEQWVYSGRRP